MVAASDEQVPRERDTTPSSGTWIFSLSDNAPNLIYLLDSCDATQPYLACVDYSYGLPLQYTLTAGHEYFIVIDGFNQSEIGSFTLGATPL